MRVENQVENGMILIRHVLGSQKRISGSDLWDLDPGSAGIIDPPSQIVDGSTGIIDPSQYLSTDPPGSDIAGTILHWDPLGSQIRHYAFVYFRSVPFIRC